MFTKEEFRIFEQILQEFKTLNQLVKGCKNEIEEINETLDNRMKQIIREVENIH